MHKTDWFYNAKWGIFTHYLCETPKTVKNFDVPRLARKIADTGAGYYFITIMQRRKYMLAPNDTYNRITGYAPGEACPEERDIIMELADELAKYGVKLCLYYTGDGPLDDPQAGAAMGLLSTKISEEPELVTKKFVENWASVLREYSMRYGDKIGAWWIDGCYPWLGYNEEYLGILADAARAGNPDVLVALNGGLSVGKCVSAYSSHDDYTTGEMTNFVDLPESRFLNGAQWHTLTFLGTFWAKSDKQIEGPALKEYVDKLNELGGVITIDIAITLEGDLFDEQLEVLSYLKK